MRRSAILVCTILLSAPAVTPVHAGSVQLGNMSLEDVTALGMDGCGLILSRAADYRSSSTFQGPYIYADDIDTALISLNGRFIKLTNTRGDRNPLTPPDGNSQDTFANATEGVTVTVRTRTTWVAPGEDSELWRVKGTLTVSTREGRQTFSVKGEGGC